MNDAAVRELAQIDPFPTINAKWGQAVVEANRKVDSLVTTLRELDHLSGILEEHGATVTIDLGPIGNAAAAARRDVERRNDRPAFRMPEPS